LVGNLIKGERTLRAVKKTVGLGVNHVVEGGEGKQNTNRIPVKSIGWWVNKKEAKNGRGHTYILGAGGAPSGKETKWKKGGKGGKELRSRSGGERFGTKAEKGLLGGGGGAGGKMRGGQ